MSEKTIIACRPGMKQAMQSAFAGMEVVVDDKLDKDYEFRKRDLTLGEMLEEDLGREERQDADPKNAHTFIVPLLLEEDLLSEYLHDIRWLAVRVANDASHGSVVTEIRNFQPTTSGSFPDVEVNISATISGLKAHLKKAGFNVLSISEADGLHFMKDA